MKITRIKCEEAREDCVANRYAEVYTAREGLERMETWSTMASSDFTGGAWKRFSKDNGRTWTEWEEETAYGKAQHQGENERQAWASDRKTWNPVHGHYLSLSVENIWLNGHLEAYAAVYGKGDGSLFAQHGYLSVTDEAGNEKKQLIRYEEGEEIDPDDWGKPEYFLKNRSHAGMPNILVDEKGDIIFAVYAPMISCLKLAKADVQEIFPSIPEHAHGIIVFHGHFNGETYDLTPVKPIVISDIRSSRGFSEPTIAKLKSGRIIVVMRGSNARPDSWKGKRINPGTPSFKWFAYSDDGGKTFTEPMPWFFDSGEVVYSSATISHIIRSEKNGKLYWIGNITAPAANIDGNYPRWPLQILEIDDTYGFAKKDTVVEIDTMREGESDKVQLSNFGILQDRETGNIEIHLTKIGQFWPHRCDSVWKSEPWKYVIELDD